MVAKEDLNEQCSKSTHWSSDIKDDKLSAPDGLPRQIKREAALNAKAKISTLAEDINQTDAVDEGSVC